LIIYSPKLLRTSQNFQEHIYEVGVRDYLTKPFDKIELVSERCNKIFVFLVSQGKLSLSDSVWDYVLLFPILELIKNYIAFYANQVKVKLHHV
jgi:response regulator RpfG family c-di-GMP phosphodiesterase